MRVLYKGKVYANPTQAAIAATNQWSWACLANILRKRTAGTRVVTDHGTFIILTETDDVVPTC